MGRELESQDRLLVEQCLAGSRTAWDEFYDRFLMLVRKVVHTHVRCREHELQDMVQNVFLALFTALNTYDHQYPLSKFVWVVGERVCIDEFRKRTASKRDGETVSVDHHDHKDPAVTVLASDLDPPEDQMADLEQRQLLKLAFKRLGDKCRDLLRLRYLQELSFKEIVCLSGGKEKSLAVQAGRCLEELKAHYARVEREGYRR
ncbi:MAG: sigma-70 family RNA polymerase sigma factor [Desulfomonile tiedjei]|nr:sigma-70 family RNA polymerase sigma factor [Desulfomonile tiedjei]